jgi:hypothetical protein
MILCLRRCVLAYKTTHMTHHTRKTPPLYYRLTHQDGWKQGFKLYQPLFSSSTPGVTHGPAGCQPRDKVTTSKGWVGRDFRTISLLSCRCLNSFCTSLTIVSKSESKTTQLTFRMHLIPKILVVQLPIPIDRPSILANSSEQDVLTYLVRVPVLGLPLPCDIQSVESGCFRILGRSESAHYHFNTIRLLLPSLPQTTNEVPSPQNTVCESI